MVEKRCMEVVAFDIRVADDLYGSYVEESHRHGWGIALETDRHCKRRVVGESTVAEARTDVCAIRAEFRYHFVVEDVVVLPVLTQWRIFHSHSQSSKLNGFVGCDSYLLVTRAVVH